MRMSYRTRQSARVAAFCLIAASAAGCSADSTRFRDGLAPIAARPAPATEVTGSVAAGRVESQPLPPPPAQPRLSSTGAMPEHRLVPPSRFAANAPRPAHEAHPHQAPKAGIHVVAPGENLSSIGRLYGKPRIEIAKANHLPVDAKLRVGQRITVPGAVAIKPPVKTAAATKPAPAPAKSAVATKPAPTPAPTVAAKPPAAPTTKVATTQPTPTAHIVTPVTETTGTTTEAAGNSPSFRWPVRGRVIGAFGAKINGQQNDGINLSVPEGTSVKAAEDGVVAYSGNELKGYGNLVLVRHANGFVTAYAHASEVLVKRGDQVKRGQIIAKAGTTGGVTSPQLHFEIRKGSTPVDPTQYLTGG